MPIEVTKLSDTARAAQLLASDTGAYVLGGGTGLMRRIHEGDGRVRHLIRLDDPSLGQITRSGGGLILGAQVTMASILNAPEVPVLHAPARSVGAPALRNMATVAGNLFAKPPYGDLATALLALDAEVMLASSTGVQRRPLEAFLRDGRPRKLITGVFVPDQPGQSFHYHKMTRTHPRGASIVTLALSLQLTGGRVNGARLACGGLAGRPTRAPGAERALQGTLTPGVIETACTRLGDGLTPFSDALASGWYRLEAAKVQLRRLLNDLV